MKESKVYDVVITGGGVARWATALALRLQGIEKILIVESSNYENIRIGESIPPNIPILLQKLGILVEFLQENYKKYLFANNPIKIESSNFINNLYK